VFQKDVSDCLSMYLNAITRKAIVKQLLWRYFFFGI